MSAEAARCYWGERLRKASQPELVIDRQSDGWCKPKGLSTLTQDIDENVSEVYGWRTPGEDSLNLY
jgi:hypothetical protein